ncbi:unnamed protein product [Orchesella dallaii]|uniref:Cathepsin L n=1 Tax=Orchesella dallaii TaxID=48710 RepID=A0ABP1QST9_9HEXA
MDAIKKKLPTCIIFLTLFNGIVATSKEYQNVTSRTMTVDEWLNSEDLFPGHVIPSNVQHMDALKMFNKLLEDHTTFSQAYERYRVQHNKESDLDDTKIENRKMFFRGNLQFIFHHNLRADLGQYRFNVGVNDFADMSDEEMTHFLGANDRIPFHPETGEHGKPENPMGNPQHIFGSNPTQFPPNYDLRQENLMSPVKNQRNCGSCVFFSMGGLVETLHASKNGGEIINVSEQMMLDCATKDNGYTENGGCNGNIMEDTLQFLQDYGVGHETHKPYKAQQQNCTGDYYPVVAKLKEWKQLEANPDALKSVLVNLKAPVAVAYLVYQPFMFYRSGIYDFCPTPGGYTGGHAVLIGGYGKFFDTEYWIVKNSWGVRWGELGYFRYMMGSQFCGLERWAFTASLE